MAKIKVNVINAENAFVTLQTTLTTEDLKIASLVAPRSLTLSDDSGTYFRVCFSNETPTLSQHGVCFKTNENENSELKFTVKCSNFDNYTKYYLQDIVNNIKAVEKEVKEVIKSIKNVDIEINNLGEEND